MSGEHHINLQDMGISDEDQQIQAGREHNPARAEAEGRLVKARYGEQLDSIKTSAALNETAGNPDEAARLKQEMNRRIEIYGTAESKKINDLLIAGARENLSAQELSINEEQNLFQFLKSVKPLDQTSDRNFNMQDMEHLASVAGSEMSVLVEKQGEKTMEYPVVKIAETADTMTFVTNGDGPTMDNRARVFKLNKSTMERIGMTLAKNADFRSAYPNSENEQAQSAVA